MQSGRHSSGQAAGAGGEGLERLGQILIFGDGIGVYRGQRCTEPAVDVHLVRRRPWDHLTTWTFAPPSKQGPALYWAATTSINDKQTEKQAHIRRVKLSRWTNACSNSFLPTPHLQLVFLSGKIKVQKRARSSQVIVNVLLRKFPYFNWCFVSGCRSTLEGESKPGALSPFRAVDREVIHIVRFRLTGWLPRSSPSLQSLPLCFKELGSLPSMYWI